MTRIALTDGSGRWFNEESAEKFSESTYWNGSNHISAATGSQWEHEALYRTRSGIWVKNHWSNWQGSSETYSEISDKAAAIWLVENEHDAHPACEEEFAALEL